MKVCCVVIKTTKAQKQNNRKEADNLYRVLFSNSKIPMLLIDPVDGAIVDANQSACDYYGYPHQQLTSLNINAINQLSDIEIKAEMHKAATQKRDHFFFIHKLADGSLRDVEVHSGQLEIDDKQLLYSIIHDITERRAAEQELKELNRNFITLLNNTSDFVYFKDRNSRFQFCSQTLADITGHSHWQDMVGKHDLEVFPPDTAKIYYEEEQPIFREGVALLNRVDPYYDEQGEKGWVSTSKWPVFDENGVDVVGLFGISRDVTAQHKAQEELKIAASVFQNISEGVMITDSKGTIIEVNQAFCQLSGYSRDEIIGRTPNFLKSGHHDASFFQSLWQSLNDNRYWQGDIWNRRKDGSIFACRTCISVLTDEEGKVDCYIGLHSDITAQLQHFKEIEHLAYYDALTELPNRVLFADRLNQTLAVADRDKTSVAVCFLDLDSFKPVNDNYGHRAGDLLLIEAANRLKDCIRAGDTAARMGGDEFALTLTQLTSEVDLQHALDRILTSIAQPFTLPIGETICVSASIGVCLYPQYRNHKSQLLRYADLAMYEAKAKGRNQYFIHGTTATAD